MNEHCTWTYTTAYGIHDTTCGKKFAFIDKGPSENGFVFCPFCGVRIKADKNGEKWTFKQVKQ